MKEVLIILDGLMEEALEKEDLKNLILGKFSKEATIEMTNYTTKNKQVDSLNCIFKILGYPPNEYDLGDRAYYEALSKGIELKDDETILRCNIVKKNEDILEDFTGGNLGDNLEEILNKINIKDGKIIHCDKYKNLLILKDEDLSILNSKCYEPHFNVNKNIEDIIPNNNLLRETIYNSASYFNKNNLENRILWPWGPCRKVNIESFKEKHKKVGTLISGIDLVCGMGIALNMNSIKPKGCNGYSNTSLTSKLKEGLKALEKDDIVIIHINGLDELAHTKNYYEKLKFIEKIQSELIIPMIESLKNKGDYNMTITCDHRTDSSTGNHEALDVPRINIKI